MQALIKEELKLNLGGAGEGFKDSRIPGFKTVDLREGPTTDFVSDVSKLAAIKDAEVSEVYASNVLEHFTHLDTVKVLSEWCRVLKPGGKLYVSVPDFDVIVKLYQKAGYTTWLNYHLFGDQKHPLNFHYTCFTFATLAKSLVDAGFNDVRRVKTFGLAEDGSCNIDSLTGTLISLNVEARK